MTGRRDAAMGSPALHSVDGPPGSPDDQRLASSHFSAVVYQIAWMAQAER